MLGGFILDAGPNALNHAPFVFVLVWVFSISSTLLLIGIVIPTRPIMGYRWESKVFPYIGLVVGFTVAGMVGFFCAVQAMRDFIAELSRLLELLKEIVGLLPDFKE